MSSCQVPLLLQVRLVVHPCLVLWKALRRGSWQTIVPVHIGDVAQSGVFPFLVAGA